MMTARIPIYFFVYFLTSALFLTGFSCSIAKAEDSAPADSLELSELVANIEGTWAEAEYVNKFLGEFTPDANDPNFMIDVQSIHQRGNTIAIYISEYCQPDLADYLIFTLRDGQLVFENAEWDGCIIDMPRIDFMYIVYDEERDVLLYEAQEVGFENYRRLELMRIPGDPLVGGGWNCHMQYHVIDILTKGSFTLFNRYNQEITLEEAFGNSDIVDELYFFEAYSTNWPMFEEICLRAPFEVVLIGSNHPKGKQQIFAIEWTSAEIKLFETITGMESEDGMFPLTKGPLAVVIRPQISPKLPENF